MTVVREIEGRIYRDWTDPRVAEWAIDRLPLLNLGNTCEPCPVFEMSLTDGLTPIHPKTESTGIFFASKKLIMSGGFEGTYGHMLALNQLDEIRALMGGRDEYTTTMLLEPDSYIWTKGRPPIMNINERIALWSTSGLVDSIVRLPEPETLHTSKHYKIIHDLLGNARWCANVENPHWREIVTRDNGFRIDVGRVMVHRPEVHTSFIYSTREKDLVELYASLWAYSLSLASETSKYELSSLLTTQEMAAYIYTIFIKGARASSLSI